MALPAAAALLLVLMPWRPTLALLGAIGLAAALVILAVTPRYAAVKAGAWGEAATGQARGGFPILLSIGVIDSATRMGFLTFLPFLLTAKGASLPTIGLALTLVFVGGAAGKLVCGLLAERVGILRTVILTEIATGLAILAVVASPLALAMVLLMPLGVALNGTSSVLYGTVAEFVRDDRQGRTFGLFYTLGSAAGATAPFAFGLISDLTSVPTALVLVAMLALATVPIALALAPHVSKAGLDAGRR